MPSEADEAERRKMDCWEGREEREKENKIGNHEGKGRRGRRKEERRTTVMEEKFKGKIKKGNNEEKDRKERREETRLTAVNEKEEKKRKREMGKGRS